MCLKGKSHFLSAIEEHRGSSNKLQLPEKQSASPFHNTGLELPQVTIRLDVLASPFLCVFLREGEVLCEWNNARCPGCEAIYACCLWELPTPVPGGNPGPPIWSDHAEANYR